MGKQGVFMAKYHSVLLVEDDEVDVMNVRRAFRKRGFRQVLHLAGDGQDALQKMRANEVSPKPDLILLDLNMPRMGGFEFLETIKEEEWFHNIDVYVMSTSSEDSDIRKTMDLGIKGYIIKPLSTEKFADALSEILG